MAEQRGADRPRDERDGERRQRGQRRGGRIGLREEQRREDEHGRGRVDVEVEELDRGADQAGEQHLSRAVDRFCGRGAGCRSSHPMIHVVSGFSRTSTGPPEGATLPMLGASSRAAPPTDRAATRGTRARGSPAAPRTPACPTTAASVSGSEALTPNTSFSIRRPAPSAATAPAAMPMSVGVMPSTTTSRTTSPRRAPSAARIPISRLRPRTM